MQISCFEGNLKLSTSNFSLSSKTLSSKRLEKSVSSYKHGLKSSVWIFKSNILCWTQIKKKNTYQVVVRRWFDTNIALQIYRFAITIAVIDCQVLRDNPLKIQSHSRNNRKLASVWPGTWFYRPMLCLPHNRSIYRIRPMDLKTSTTEKTLSVSYFYVICKSRTKSVDCCGGVFVRKKRIIFVG